MSIKALSNVSFANSVRSRQKKMSEKNQTSVQNTNSFELPKYNSSAVSFGMARIDMEKLKKRNELEQKYFVKNEHGKFPVARMSIKELKDVVDELCAHDPGLVAKLFLTKINEKEGLIAHSPQKEVLMFMNNYLDKLPNGEKYLKQIYLTQNSSGKLPAHNIHRPDELKGMANSLDIETLAKVFTTEDKEQYIPSDFYTKDGMQAYVMELFEEDSEILDKIVFHKDKDGNYPPLNGVDDLNKFCELYKDEPEKLRQYFIRKEDDGEEYLNAFFSTVDDEYEFLNTLDRLFIDSHPEILKDIYTLKNRPDGDCLADLLCQYEPKDILPEHLIKLITDSDLSEEDSLKLLTENRELLINSYVSSKADFVYSDEIALIENYLKDKVQENQRNV